MYHIHTKMNSFDSGTYNFILSQDFSAHTKNNPETASRMLRRIADQSFDLLSQIQKLDKLDKLGHLSSKEKSELLGLTRLVGIMVHILEQYKYQDSEMMDALLSRFHKLDSLKKNEAA
jgi:hypothetical protein